LLLVYHYDGKRVGKYNISIHKHRHVTKRIKLSKLYAAKKRTLSRVFFFFSLIIEISNLVEGAGQLWHACRAIEFIQAFEKKNTCTRFGKNKKNKREAKLTWTELLSLQ
jgi:uncharacterized paraquat-inducible protein A